MSVNWVDYFQLKRWSLFGVALAGGIFYLLSQRNSNLIGDDLSLPETALISGSLVAICLLISNIIQVDIVDRIIIVRRNFGIKKKLIDIGYEEQEILRKSFKSGEQIVRGASKSQGALVLEKWGMLERVESDDTFIIPYYIWWNLTNRAEKYPWIDLGGASHPSIVTYFRDHKLLKDLPDSNQKFQHKVRLGLLFSSLNREKFMAFVYYKVDKTIYRIEEPMSITIEPWITFHCRFGAKRVDDCWVVWERNFLDDENVSVD